MSDQLGLFGGSAPPNPLDPVAPVPEHQEWAAAMPLVRLGTSSWSFPGWEGIVYAGKASKSQLSRHGLRAYSQHPLLRTVSIDRTHYAPVPPSVLADYAAQVDEDFRFVIKAHEACSLARWPRHRRYGAVAGSANDLCFDASYARDKVVQPAVEGLGAACGAIVFQLPPQDPTLLGGPNGFPDRLHRFLSALPKGPTYAVELRNRDLLTTSYATALRDAGGVHCFNQHPTMPPIEEQRRVTGQQPTTVVRWMLGEGRSYEADRERFAPFNTLCAPDEPVRMSIVDVITDALGDHREVLTIINNKAEGSSPRSVVALANALAGRLLR